jgi:hypothetical protein
MFHSSGNTAKSAPMDLASRHRLRDGIDPHPHPECSAGKQAANNEPQQYGKGRGRNYSWDQLMRRVFAIDVLQCPACQGRMRIVAAIQAPEAIRKILECLGLPARPPLSRSPTR